MRIACECVVVEVRYVADRVAEVCRVAGHPVESRRADCAVEVCRLTAEVRRLAAHPVEVSVSLLRCAVSLPILWRCTISLTIAWSCSISLTPLCSHAVSLVIL